MEHNEHDANEALALAKVHTARAEWARSAGLPELEREERDRARLYDREWRAARAARTLAQ